MKKTLALYKMWLKCAIKLIPVVLAGTVVLAAFVAGAAFAGVKLLASKDDMDKIPVALVINDDNTYTQMAISYLLEEETIKETCTFTQMGEEEAQRALKTGGVSAVIVIPENFMVSVLYGEDVTAQLILSESDMTTQSKIFQKMIRSGAMDLVTAQSAIYAVDDLCRATGIDAIRESEEYLNLHLLMYALRRNTYFGKQILSDTGDFSPVQFYTAGGIVLLLMLAAITCGELLKKEKESYTQALCRVGVNIHSLLAAKLLSVSAVYVGIFIVIYLAALSQKAIVFSFAALPAAAAMILAVFSIHLLIFQIAGSRATGTLAGFLVTVVMMFLSGNFIPASFLPRLVNIIGNIMPTKWITALCGQILTGEILWQTVCICFVISVLMFGMAVGTLAWNRKTGVNL